MVLSNYTPLHQVIVQALDTEGMDMEIDLSNLGTVNTMFTALFSGILLGRLGAISVLELLQPLILFAYSKLGVPIKTTITANVLEEALNGIVTIKPLPIGTSVSGKVLTWFMS